MRLIVMFSTMAAFIAIQCFEGCDRDDIGRLFADHSDSYQSIQKNY